MRKNFLVSLAFLVFLIGNVSAVVCEPPETDPYPDYPKITILSPLEGETYNYREIFTEVISNQEIDYWGYILNGGKYFSFNPNKTITYSEGENLLIVYGSNEKGFSRAQVKFYVRLNGEPPVDPYCGDGICSPEIGENKNTCPQDCGYPPNNGNGEDKDEECCCCTSQGFIEYGKPIESKVSFSSGNVVNNGPIVLNQRFGEEKENNFWIYSLVVLLFLLLILLLVWFIFRN